MDIFPAIDLKDGRVVRLLQGDYGQVTAYPVSPVEAAENFAALSGLSKIVLSFSMLIGRLEIYPIIILFTPSAWRKD